jgi:HPt (histidine-containing phosphotransfer) domain-containing protein
VTLPLTINDEDQALSYLEQLNVKGLNVAKGIDMYEDTEVIYLKLLIRFVENLGEKLKAIETISQETLSDYCIRIHGIKGVSLSVNADEIGRLAQLLEDASHKGDLDYVLANNPHFLATCNSFIEDLSTQLTKIMGC